MTKLLQMHMTCQPNCGHQKIIEPLSRISNKNMVKKIRKAYHTVLEASKILQQRFQLA